MRHKKRRTRLGKQHSHRVSLIKNMVRSLFLFQKIRTTRRRAKEARRLAERLITLGKKNTLTTRRRAYAMLPDRTIIVKLFNEIAPLFKSRIGGYTRIIPLQFRKGDNASMVILELTEKKAIEKSPAKKRGDIEKKKRETAKVEKQKDQKIEPASPPKAAREKEKAQEKAREAAQGKAKERARAEHKQIEKKKGFFKNLRGYFKRKTDM